MKRCMIVCTAVAAFSCGAMRSAHAESLSFDCVMEPSKVLDLGSSVAGLIDSILVERGQIVQAGDVVARLRSEAEEARLAQARTRAESDAQIDAQRAALDLARARSERVEQLRERAVASDAQAEEVEAELNTALMNLRLAELQKELDRIARQEAEINVGLRQIKSPVDGVVTDLNRGPGEYVFQETHVLTVAQINPLYVHALMPVEIYGNTQTGMTVMVRVSLPDERVIPAEITIVDRVLNAAAGSFGIRAEIANPDGLIPAGQTCKLSLDVS